MGGRGRSRTQRKHFRDNRENVWKRPKPDSSNDAKQDEEAKRHTPWEPFQTQNLAFDDYYREQGIVSDEEWDVLIEYLRKPLPAAFRINSSSQFYVDIRAQLENDFMKSIQSEDANGNQVEAIKPLPWYPDNLAWQSNFSRMQLRKNQTLERFHEFLKLENEIGNITRQEAVSMVPPLFLDVRPNHFVLDMCAAPGSKTFQLLEMIHELTEPGKLPSGMVIANDLDVQRCNLLIHQTKRMCTANLIVTNHEAQHFPSCRLRKKNNLIENIEENAINQLQFDRVLCDVPCSGDGTLRKAPDIWRTWNAGNGNGLHGLQVQIAMRGIALLKVGGRMVYSTCSMNPIENEAVVAEVLRRCEGSIELMDVSTEIPKLFRRQGLKTWKVRDKGQWLASYKDVPKSRQSVLHPGMFPKRVETFENDHEMSNEQLCENGDENSGNGVDLKDDSKNNLEAEESDLPLERCMRIVPHDQNSGAFFIAVFHKLASLPATQKKSDDDLKITDTNEAEILMKNNIKEHSNGEGSNSTNAADVQITEANLDPEIIDNEINGGEKDETAPPAKNITGKRKLQIQGKWRGVDPVVFYREDAVVNTIIEFYGIKESFPFKGHLITRNEDMNHAKRIYYVSDSVKEVLELNFLSGQQLKIASVGLKMFERQTSKEGTSAPCLFRISSEGLPLILPYVTKQIVYASTVDFKHLLQYKSIKFQDFVNPELREKASNLILGCCVVVLNKDSQVASNVLQEDETPIAIGCWKGRTSVSVMVAALDCQEYLERMSILTTEEPSIPEVMTSIPEGDEQGKIDGSEIREDDKISNETSTNFVA